MLTLTAGEFGTPSGADEALEKVTELHIEMLQLHDAAAVSCSSGQQKPENRELHGISKAGTSG